MDVSFNLLNKTSSLYKKPNDTLPNPGHEILLKQILRSKSILHLQCIETGIQKGSEG